MVGAGSSYRDAALVARERAKRLRADPETGELRFSRHGSLVMDWVEVFAPVVFEPYRPRTWPASGSLLLDDLPFRVRDPDSGRHRIAFRVFSAMGYQAGRAKLWRLEARASRRPTGRRSSVPLTALRRGLCATPTTASPAPRPSRPISPTSCLNVWLSSPRAIRRPLAEMKNAGDECIGKRTSR